MPTYNLTVTDRLHGSDSESLDYPILVTEELGNIACHSKDLNKAWFRFPVPCRMELTCGEPGNPTPPAEYAIPRRWISGSSGNTQWTIHPLELEGPQPD